MNFRALENQSGSWNSPGNLFPKKGTNPVKMRAWVALTKDIMFPQDHCMLETY